MDTASALASCGIIAILRGITPEEALPVAEALFESGIRVVEVPLNSPDPFASISKMSTTFGDRLVIGAGTVLSVADVNMLQQSGGRISVSPDCNTEVIARACALGLEAFPGVFTPTEAFTAIRAGARNLKLFPAEAASPAVVKAWRAVLPPGIGVFAVGGITPGNMRDWLSAGVSGFGIGSSLYKPGMAVADVGAKAAALVEAYRKARTD